MNLDMVLAVDVSKHVVAWNRMTARLEDKLMNILISDIDRLFLVKILRQHHIVCRGIGIVFRLLPLLLFSEERHITEPTLRGFLLFLSLTQQLMQVLISEDNVFLSKSLQQLLMFINLVQRTELVEHRECKFKGVALQELVENLLAAFLHFPTLTTEYSLYLGLCLCRIYEINPRSLYVLRVGSKNLHLVATAQLMAERHEFMVHLGSDTMTSEEGMYLKGEVECRTPGRHGLYLSLWCKYEYFGCEEVQLDSIEEVHSVRLWIIKNLLNSTEPVVQFTVILADFPYWSNAVFIFPMCGKTLFGYFVHSL